MLSPKECAVFASYGHRKLRSKERSLHMTVDEVVMRYGRLALHHSAVLDQLAAAQKRIGELEKELVALKPNEGEPKPDANA